MQSIIILYCMADECERVGGYLRRNILICIECPWLQVANRMEIFLLKNAWFPNLVFFFI